MENCKFGTELLAGLHLWEMAESLEWIRSCGYDFFELCLSEFPLIVHGEVNWPYVDCLKPIIKGSGLSATVHIGTGLDLRNSGEYAPHRKALLSSKPRKRLFEESGAADS